MSVKPVNLMQSPSNPHPPFTHTHCHHTAALHPLLVVSSVLGEVLVLQLPDASAIQAASTGDGTLTRGSLVRAFMRAQSHVTALAVQPAPPPAAGEGRSGGGAGGGHFWVFTAHADKSVRRYRMCTGKRGGVEGCGVGWRVWQGREVGRCRCRRAWVVLLRWRAGEVLERCVLADSVRSVRRLYSFPRVFRGMSWTEMATASIAALNYCYIAHAFSDLGSCPPTEQQKVAGAAAARAAAAAAIVDGAGAAAGGATGARHAAQRTPATAGAMAGVGMTRNATMLSSSLQSFQMPESEKPMEFQLPANAISVTTVAVPPSNTSNTSTGCGPAAAHALRMVVGCSDGTVSVYGLPEMALQGRWLLHDLSYGGCTAVCAMGDQLVSVGGEGTVQVSSLMEYGRLCAR